MSGLVSVVIPIYNGEAHLEETLQSVLSQSYSAIEVIAVDDGSKDQSQVILKRHPSIQVIDQNNRGNASARNHGLDSARGEYIAFIDQDDLWHPDKLSKQVALLEEDKDVLFTLSHFLSFGEERPDWCREETFIEAKPDYSPSSLVARREAFNTVGRFNEELQAASDVDWFFLAKDLQVKWEIVPEVLHWRRVHTQNQSNNYKKLHLEMLSLVRRSVQRKKS